MQTVIATRTINAPIEDAFGAYTDREGLADLPMVLSAKVVVPGTSENNGLGAVREVGRATLEEVPGGTHVTWQTVFGLHLPLVGSKAEPALALAFRTIFTMVLAQVAKRATASKAGR